MTTTAFQLGSLTVTPSIAVTNVGRDTNIFNESTGEQGDFTATFVPAVQLALPASVTRLTAKTSVEYLYFKTSASQRAFNVSQSGRVEFPAGRLSPYVEVDFLNTSQRPNPEIDLRVHQRTQQAMLGTSVRIGPDTSLDLSVTKLRLHYGDVNIGAVDLAQELSRNSTDVAANFKYALTSLTTLLVTADIAEDRFAQAAERSANTQRVLAGFNFEPTAVISGRVLLGYRRFTLVSGSAAPFTGLVADVGAHYTVADSTQVAVAAYRDVTYSYDPGTPYFVITSGTLSLTQVLGGRWDAVARYGRAWMSYRGLVVGPSGNSRSDRTALSGAGVEYRLTGALRVGFEVDYTRRLSAMDSRQFHGYRYGGSFTYGGG